MRVVLPGQASIPICRLIVSEQSRVNYRQTGSNPEKWVISGSATNRSELAFGAPVGLDELLVLLLPIENGKALFRDAD